jgi:hypothetical protein
MKWGCILRLACVWCAGLSIGVAQAAASKQVLVYYMPWFSAKPYGADWGWHWTMDHFNPDVIQATGERQIASWYYPLIGPYDSADSAVLEYHALLMKLAGVDGVVVDWYGMDDYLDYGLNNRHTAALFKAIRKAGLKFSLCYEDQTIQKEVTGGFISAAEAVVHAQQTMLYVQTNYFIDPGFLRWSNRPVLLNFGPQYFKTNAQWQALFSVLDPTNQPAFFTEDNRLPVGAGAFDWPPMWLSQAPGTGGVLSVGALENYLEKFCESGSQWPAYISSAFPRFHDIYQKAGVRDYWGYLGDRNGDTLRQTLKRAFTDNSAFVLVVTWNDFGEGTSVEPTREYGYRDLGIIQEARREYLEPGFQGQTNELGLATRLFHLRRQCSTNATLSVQLDQVFTNILSGSLSEANSELKRLESDAAFSPPAAAGR